MTEETRNNQIEQNGQALDHGSLAAKEAQESSIDFGKIFKDLLKHKKLYFIVLPVAFVLAAIYALSLPNFYSCTVKLAPELGERSGASALSGLAGAFGVNMGGGGAAGGDAIGPTLYPDLMNSVDFKTSLFSVKVKRDDDRKEMTYYDYLLKERKAPWWKGIIPGIMGIFSSDAPIPQQQNKLEAFRLTPQQAAIADAINGNVVCTVDNKTGVIIISVKDQDPLVCALMADSVKTPLQKLITDYRTSHVRVDLAYNQKLYKEAKARYEKARQLYAQFSDANQEVILQSVQTKETDLENEMQLQYNIYQQVVANLQEAEMKVQKETPAFTTLQSATVPLIKAGPKRAQMCLIFVFLAFLGATAWILYKEDDLKPLLGLS